MKSTLRCPLHKAAPDLLAACETAAAVIEDWAEYSADESAALDALRAAIRKATEGGAS